VVAIGSFLKGVIPSANDKKALKTVALSYDNPPILRAPTYEVN
jgi:hypothetical protein